MSSTRFAAGVLPLFDDGQTVLLGRELRSASGLEAWMGFGGKQEPGESSAETAVREAKEETAGVLNITLAQVTAVEASGHFVDYYNPRSGVHYRMYCLRVSGDKPPVAAFSAAAEAIQRKDVEKVEWRYFDARSVIFSPDGALPGTDVKLYDTERVRLALLREAPFLGELLGSS